jgi:hypothetical protein
MHFGIVYEICQFLNYFDMLNITELSPDKDALRKTFSPQKYINDRLLYLGINAQEFNKSLIASGSFVSGSFPLQCLLGEFWDSDIDVYNNSTKCPKHDEMKRINNYIYPDEEYFYFGFFQGQSKIINPWLEKTFNSKHNKIGIQQYFHPRTSSPDTIYDATQYNDKGLGSIVYHFYDHLNINYVFDMEINKHPCQFIVFNDTEDNVIDCSDFEFCKLKYDGKKVHMLSDMSIIKNKKYTLTQEHIDDIFTRTILSVGSGGVEHFGRDHDPKMDKHLRFKENVVHDKELFRKHVMGRVEKYRKRGFKITMA